MSPDVIVAVADGQMVRAFYRDAQGDMDQVLQIAGSAEPAELAGIVADLGDRFGWGERAKPAGPPMALPRAKPARNTTASGGTSLGAGGMNPAKQAQIAREAEQVRAFIVSHPRCSRREIADGVWPGHGWSTMKISTVVKHRMGFMGVEPRVFPGRGPDPDRYQID